MRDGVSVVLFTDLVESTAWLARLGDERMDELTRRHFDDVRAAVSRHGGTVHKLVGDGVMASFASAVGALAAAAEIPWRW